MGYFADVIRDSRRAAKPAAEPRFDAASAVAPEAVVGGRPAPIAIERPAAPRVDGRAPAPPVAHASAAPGAVVQREPLSPATSKARARAPATAGVPTPLASPAAPAAAGVEHAASSIVAAARDAVLNARHAPERPSARETAAAHAAPGTIAGDPGEPLVSFTHPSPASVVALAHDAHQGAALPQVTPLAPARGPDSSIGLVPVAPRARVLETSHVVEPAPESVVVHEPVTAKAWTPEPRDTRREAPARPAPQRGVSVHVGRINVVVQAPAVRPAPRPSNPGNAESRGFLRSL